MTHEILIPESYRAEKDAKLSIGVVTDINYTIDDQSIDLTIGEETYDEVPVFYHCQRSEDVVNGVYAFSPTDRVMVLHSLPDEETGAVSEPHIIGFGDGELRFCSSPLIACGYIDPSYIHQTTGQSVVYYNQKFDGLNNPFLFCREIEPAGPLGHASFFQVKYTPYPVPYERVEIINEEEVRTEAERDVVFCLAIAKGFLLDQNEPHSPVQQTNAIRISCTTASETFKIFSWTHNEPIELDPTILNHNASFSANFNEDFTKLYVVFHVDDDPMADPGESIVYYRIFERSVGDNFETIDWEQIDSGSYEYTRDIMHLYVDRWGVVWGLYTELEDSNFEYYKFDLSDGILLETDRVSVGYSVTDGDFAGVFEHYEEDSDTTCYAIADFTPDPSSVFYSNFSDPPCSITVTGSGYSSAIAFKDYRASAVGEQTYYLGAEEYLTESSAGTIAIFDNSVSASSYSVTYRMKHTRGGYVSRYSCENGVLSKYENGRIVSYDKTITLNYDDPLDDEDREGYLETVYDLGYANFSTSDYALINSCDPAEWPAQYLRNTYAPYITKCFIGNNHHEMFYPFDVEAEANKRASFIAWDNNEGGIIIKGMKYLDTSDVWHLIIEIANNETPDMGHDIEDALLTCTGFDVDNFHYLGFMF